MQASESRCKNDKAVPGQPAALGSRAWAALTSFLAALLLFPLQLALVLLFLLAEGIRLLLPGTWRPIAETAGAPAPECSIVVLNWNGRHLLEESLPALERALEHQGGCHEILLVDNGSSDDSLEWVARHHPAVRRLALEENLGFGEGNNRGVEAARHEIVVLLNNDMIVEEDFLGPLIEGFRDPEVFAVTSQILFPEGKRRQETGNTRARFRQGYLELSHAPLEPCHSSRRLPVLWAGGGSSAFQRRRFLELGGFSSLFSPCYLEDTDLSYRAWRRGWKVLLAAGSRVLHRHRSSTSRRFEASELEELIETHKLWYLWKNYQWRTLAPHLLLLPLHLGRRLPWRSYGEALARLPAVLAARLGEPQRRLSDRTLFAWQHRPLLYLNKRCRPAPAPRVDGPLRVLVVSAYLPHLGRHGGAGRVFQLLRRVAERHQVSLVSFVESEEEVEAARALAPFCHRLELVRRRHYRPLSPFPYEPFEEFHSDEFRRRLERVLTEEDFDLVHFEWTQMALYADLAPHLPRLLTEIEVNYAAHQTRLAYETGFLRKWKTFYDTLQTFQREIQMCRRANAIICMTETDRDFLRGYLPDRLLHVVNTGVDTAFFTPDGAPEADSLLFVGAFRHQPNVDGMLFFCREVLPLILQSRPDVQLYIVGSSPPPAVRRLGSHPNVTVTGFVEDIRPYYHRAQVVVVPLRTGVGIRGKILEGWAAGKAMVATSQACLGIRARHGENILVADDPADFARWTEALLAHPDFCRRLGEAGRQTALRYYEWDRIAEQMLRLYQDVAAGARGGRQPDQRGPSGRRHAP